MGQDRRGPGFNHGPISIVRPKALPTKAPISSRVYEVTESTVGRLGFPRAPNLWEMCKQTQHGQQPKLPAMQHATRPGRIRKWPASWMSMLDGSCNRSSTLLNVGNPSCAEDVLAEKRPCAWGQTKASIENGFANMSASPEPWVGSSAQAPRGPSISASCRPKLSCGDEC